MSAPAPMTSTNGSEPKADKSMSYTPTHPVEHTEFDVDAVLFDMDGTLLDSIPAVEAAWGAVAREISRDAQEVIDATHGRRAIDNLKELKPELRNLSDAEMEPHVAAFERSILREADEFQEKVRSRRSSEASSRRSSRRSSTAASRRASNTSGPNPLLSNTLSSLRGMTKMEKKDGNNDSRGSDSAGASGAAAGENGEDGAPNLDNVNAKLADLSTNDRMANLDSPFDDDDDDDDDNVSISSDETGFDLADYTEEEIGCADKSVKILPGVRRFIDSLPKGRFAVATSGAKTYCHGALARAGIKRPPVTITADDPRLKNGKPFPDPFLLAAKELGYDIKKCLVFEDSPSGIKAGVASGAKTIAVCTSHPAEKINGAGAHYILPHMDCVWAKRNKDGTIHITIDAHPIGHPRHGSRGSFAVPGSDRLTPAGSGHSTPARPSMSSMTGA